MLGLARHCLVTVGVVWQPAPPLSLIIIDAGCIAASVDSRLVASVCLSVRSLEGEQLELSTLQSEVGSPWQALGMH